MLPFADLRCSTSRRCEQASLCVVVGSSFRDHDAVTRLRSAARLNANLRVFIISPDALVLKDQLNGIVVEPAHGCFNRQHGYLPRLEKVLESARETVGLRTTLVRVG